MPAVNKAVVAVAVGATEASQAVGEQLAERESGRTFEVVERQLERGLRDLTSDEVAGRLRMRRNNALMSLASSAS